MISDRFSIAVPQQEVMRWSGLPVLWVLIFPNATSGVAFLFNTQSTTWGEICPLHSHLEHHFSTEQMCLEVGLNCKSLQWSSLLFRIWLFYKLPETGKKHNIQSKLSCNSKNVTCLASCTKCHLQYIGSTTTEFGIGFWSRGSVVSTDGRTCGVAVHFDRSVRGLDDFLFRCVDRVAVSDDSQNLDSS